MGILVDMLSNLFNQTSKTKCTYSETHDRILPSDTMGYRQKENLSKSYILQLSQVVFEINKYAIINLDIQIYLDNFTFIKIIIIHCFNNFFLYFRFNSILSKIIHYNISFFLATLKFLNLNNSLIRFFAIPTFITY